MGEDIGKVVSRVRARPAERKEEESEDGEEEDVQSRSGGTGERSRRWAYAIGEFEGVEGREGAREEESK